MSIFQESDIQFDFSAALFAVRHDAENRVFPGVDFVIEDTDEHIWLEVKNWEGSSIPANRRGGQRKSFLAKLHGKTFYTETLRARFTGTLAYFALTNNPPIKDIRYVTLLESPRMDSALMLRASDRLRGLVVRERLWHIAVDAAVVNLPEWQARFPDYPATAI